MTWVIVAVAVLALAAAYLGYSAYQNYLVQKRREETQKGFGQIGEVIGGFLPGGAVLGENIGRALGGVFASFET